MSGISIKNGILVFLLALVIQIEWSWAAAPYEVIKWMPLSLQNLVIEGLQQNRKLQSIQDEIDELQDAARRFDELDELASLIEALHAKSPTTDDVRTLGRLT